MLLPSHSLLSLPASAPPPFTIGVWTDELRLCVIQIYLVEIHKIKGANTGAVEVSAMGQSFSPTFKIELIIDDFDMVFKARRNVVMTRFDHVLSTKRRFEI